MKRCCLLVSFVLIIGLGICGYIYRDVIIQEYHKWNNDSGSNKTAENGEIDFVGEVTTQIYVEETTTTQAATTESPVVTTTGKPIVETTSESVKTDLSQYDSYEDDIEPIETTTSPTTTSRPDNTTTTPRDHQMTGNNLKPTDSKFETTTNKIHEGSGGIDSMVRKNKPRLKDEYDDEDYTTAGSGNDD